MSSDNLRTANWLGYSSSALYTLYKALSKRPIPKLKFTNVNVAMCQNFYGFCGCLNCFSGDMIGFGLSFM